MILFTIATIAVSCAVQHQITKKRIESNSKLRELREEYARKRQEHQHELAMKLMREGQQLQFQLQQEMFDAQMKQVKTAFVAELEDATQMQVYQNWPLKVLPCVIQNQSLSNLLLINKDTGVLPPYDRFALHCILLPSSCPTFNANVWLTLESKLEAFCNQYWNSTTGRPVLFYSGSWNRYDSTMLGNRSIHGASSTDKYDLYKSMKQLPTVLIHPDFDMDGNLVIDVKIWGMPEIEDIEEETYSPDKFQRDYTSEINYREDADAAKEAIEDLTPYIESLIGYMADTYFWHASNAAPLLPSLIQNGDVNTNGMLYIRESAVEFYNEMFKQVEEESAKDEFSSQNISNLFKGISVLWSEQERMQKLTSLYIQHINRTTGRHYTNLANMMLGELNMATPRILPNSMENSDEKLTIDCNGVKFVMIKVEHGSFWMGATEEYTKYAEDEKPVHKVYITNDYYIGEVPVTQALWRAVMNNNPSYFGEGGKGSFKEQWENLPVENVSWYDCQEFIIKLNEMTGKKFRLPKEAEWEFAARGGEQK